MKSRLVVLTLGLLCAGVAVGQDAPAEEESSPQMMQMMQMMQQRMMQEGGEMAAEHDALVDRMRASGERLDDLLATMNSAEGDERAVAMADVLSELVAEREVLIQAVIELQPRMMRHMMQHMGMMGMGMMSESPMMQSLGDESSEPAEPAEEDHEEHH